MDPTDNISGLDEFLRCQPFISIQPTEGQDLLLEGDFELNQAVVGYPAVTDSYRLRITVPSAFPDKPPIVTELAGKIPPLADFHNGGGSLCLGSPLRLVVELVKEPNLHAFSRRIIVPYLYAMSLKLKHSINFIFGELQHGRDGERDDYLDLLGLKHHKQIEPAFACLTKKKRIANKLPCPCGCKRRLGKCRYNATIRELRKILPKHQIHEILKSWIKICSHLNQKN